MTTKKTHESLVDGWWALNKAERAPSEAVMNPKTPKTVTIDSKRRPVVASSSDGSLLVKCTPKRKVAR